MIQMTIKMKKNQRMIKTTQMMIPTMTPTTHLQKMIKTTLTMIPTMIQTTQLKITSRMMT